MKKSGTGCCFLVVYTVFDSYGVAATHSLPTFHAFGVARNVRTASIVYIDVSGTETVAVLS